MISTRKYEKVIDSMMLRRSDFASEQKNVKQRAHPDARFVSPPAMIC